MGLKLCGCFCSLSEKKRQSDLYVALNKFLVNLYSHLEGESLLAAERTVAVGGSDASAGRFCRSWRHRAGWELRAPTQPGQSREVENVGVQSALGLSGASWCVGLSLSLPALGTGERE